MVVNHNKNEASTRVIASGDVAEAEHVLADLVTGEKIPFAVKDGQLSFQTTCGDRWARALALLPKAPAAIDVSASAPNDEGGKLMLGVRLLGGDGQPVRSTLPFDLEVRDPSGTVRDDLSGVRVAVRGAYVSAVRWPVNAPVGAWTVTASETISASSDTASWQSR